MLVVKRQKVDVGVSVASVAVKAVKKKRFDETDEWWDHAVLEGDFVHKDEHGYWRTVPGFPKNAIRVSSKGWVQAWSARQKAWERPKRGSEGAKYYLKVIVHGSSYGVHKLINRAFHGAPPSREHTTDHRHKRPDGDKRKERQDNREENLHWETTSGQRNNQTRTDAPRIDDRPLEVRSERTRDGWVRDEWVRFQSQGKTAKAMGVDQASVSCWLAGRYTCSLGWRLRWAEPDEPQEDLPATGYAPGYDLAEVWVEVDDKTWVSNRGRAWKPYRKSAAWRKYTPRATEGAGVYPTITVGGEQNHFYTVLFDAFFPGVRGDRTIDHINRDPSDNRLANLRPATRSEQNLNQTRKPKGDGNMDSKKTRIRYRRADAPDDAPWEECLGASELARHLTDATGEKYWQGAISKASNGKKGEKPHKYKDYVFHKL